MTKLKKIIILAVAVALGATFLLNSMENTKSKASEKNQFIVFGPVDTSEDEDYEAEEFDDYEDEDDSDDDGSWLDNFIENHKTPFSKTIDK